MGYNIPEDHHGSTPESVKSNLEKYTSVSEKTIQDIMRPGVTRIHEADEKVFSDAEQKLQWMTRLMNGDPVLMLAIEIAEEVKRATVKHGAMNSPHEGYAVILEELDELWEHVMADTGRSEGAKKEAIQIAAMGLKYAHNLC